MLHKHWMWCIEEHEVSGIRKEAVMIYFKVLFRYLLGETEEKLNQDIR
jgi:hypothetical protein